MTSPEPMNGEPFALAWRSVYELAHWRSVAWGMLTLTSTFCGASVAAVAFAQDPAQIAGGDYTTLGAGGLIGYIVVQTLGHVGTLAKAAERLSQDGLTINHRNRSDE